MAVTRDINSMLHNYAPLAMLIDLKVLSYLLVISDQYFKISNFEKKLIFAKFYQGQEKMGGGGYDCILSI